MLTLRKTVLFIACLPFIVGAAQPINAIIAIIGDTVITELDIQNQLQFLEQQGIEGDKLEVFDQLVERHLQINRAKLQNLVVDVDRRVTEIRYEIENENNKEFANDEEFNQFLIDQHQKNYTQFREEVEEELLMQLVFQIEVFSTVQISDAEIDEFLQTETEAGIEKIYHIQHLLIEQQPSSDISDEALYEFALTLREKIDNTNWLTIGNSYSTDNIKVAIDDLGVRNIDQLPDNFVTIARDLSQGEVSHIIQVPGKIHLIKLIDSRGGGIRTEITRVQLSHVFLPSDQKQLSKELFASIKNGELTFNEAVKKHSIDEISVDRGGSLGEILLDDLPDYLRNAVEEMQEGDLNNIASPYGLHILRLDKRDVSELDINAMREKIAFILRRRNAFDSRESWIKNLRQTTKVVILDPTYL